MRKKAKQEKRTIKILYTCGESMTAAERVIEVDHSTNPLREAETAMKAAMGDVPYRIWYWWYES